MSSQEVGRVRIAEAVIFPPVVVDSVPGDGVVVIPRDGGSALKITGGLTVKGIRFEDGHTPEDGEMLEAFCIGPGSATLKKDDAPDGEKFVTLVGLDSPTLPPYRWRIQIHYEADLNGWLVADWSLL